MSTLSSSSTYDEVVAAYDDNASYSEDGSAAKAAAFITACRFLLRHIPRRVRQGGGHEVETDPTQLRAEISEARAWLASHGPSAPAGGVVHPSFESLRS